ncbi:hypothetical protein C8Q75DRAFT_803536 [Abortiporus biennis]|nr:hypothetical protein C8Q75DRAFT_803536 [Abortiporus biennis]
MILNFDILLNTTEFLDFRRDWLSVMLTCRTLYQATLPRFLSLPLRFKEHSPRTDLSRNNRRFLEYMARFPSRYKYIKDVSVDWDDWDLIAEEAEKPWQALTDILLVVMTHATNLKELHIYMPYGDTKEFLPVYPITCSHLQTLHLHNIDVVAAKFLKNLHAPLKKLYIRYETNIDDDEDRQTLPLIANFANTLEKLDIEEGRWFFEPTDPLVVFPRLRSLRSTLCGIPDIAAMVRAFPNLSSLRIHNDGDTSDHMLEDHRLRNIAEQRELELVGLPLWSKLDKLDGDVVLVNGLGLSCQVDRLKLDGCERQWLQECRIALSDTRPKTLHLSMSDNRLAGIFGRRDIDEDLSMMFAYSGLSHLNLQYHFNSYEKSTAPEVAEAILNDLIRALEKASILSFLQLQFYWSVPYSIVQRMQGIPQPPDLVGEHFNRMDKTALAQRITKAIPSLRYLIFHHPSSHSGKNFGWRIVPGEDNVGDDLASRASKHLHEISWEEGSQISGLYFKCSY